MATRRIFQLAKELGVKSTAIVEKCQAEGLSVKNHMSTLSVGLEATICEWFSETDLATTVEKTDRVDLEKVKSAPRRRRKKKEGSDESSVGVAVLEAPAESVAETEQTSPIELPAKVARTSKVQPKRLSPKEKIAAEKAGKSGEPADVAEEETTEETKQVQLGPRIISKIIPKKFEKIGVKPVKFVPTPAVLEGPKVIRTDRPDILPVPPSRTFRRPRPAAEASDTGVTPREDGKVSGKRTHRRVSRIGDQDTAEKKTHKQSQRRSRRGKHFVGDAVVGSHEFGDRDLRERQERLAQASGTLLHRRKRRLAHEEHEAGSTATIEHRQIEKAVVKKPITVKELCSAIGVRSVDIIGKLMKMGVMATINQSIDSDAAIAVAMEFGVELEVEEKKLLLDELRENFASITVEESMVPRPPIVAFLGHVDHGKTSLLDRIRRASVAGGEAGGITQHIGSYLYDDGKRRVTFLDTPGHKAFTEMRARGANMTDIVVLVVAADDGVMPQTEEAINHARAADVPIVVALNKIDVPNADVNRALGQLAEKKLVSSEWGGDTEIVQTSAMTGAGIEDLVEHLDYVAELHQLKSRPDGPAMGWVIESEMSTGQGAIARLLIKDGTLKVGDIVVTGCSYGRVRTIQDATGRGLEEATPAMPVQITGLDEVPAAGEAFYVVQNVPRAAEIAAEQQSRKREITLTRRRQVTLENLFSEIAAGDIKELNVIVKADVQGSVDVLRKAITEMNTSEVAVRILHAAVGGISENDVVLAKASNAIIIGFQVVADEYARVLAERDNVQIKFYRVIYKITDDIRQALEGMLTPDIEEKTVGRADVRQIFRISRVGVVAGCYVLNGVINRSAKIRVIRDSVVIRDNNAIETIRRIKDDKSEVRSGLECGIRLAGFDDIKIGDIIEAFEHIEIIRTLESVRNKESDKVTT